MPGSSGMLIDGRFRSTPLRTVSVADRWNCVRGDVEGQARVAGLGQVDPTAAEVERVGRRVEVLLDHRGLRGRLQGGLDLTRRPVRVQGDAAAPRTRRCAGTTSRCRRWPGSTRRSGPLAMLSGVGVLPARICTPGAVTSGLSQLPPGPRDENAAITSP